MVTEKEIALMRAKLVRAGRIHPDDIPDGDSMWVLEKRQEAYQVQDRNSSDWNHWLPTRTGIDNHNKWMRSQILR